MFNMYMDGQEKSLIDLNKALEKSEAEYLLLKKAFDQLSDEKSCLEEKLKLFEGKVDFKPGMDAHPVKSFSYSERFNAILDAITDTIFIHDRNGVCIEYFKTADTKTFFPEESIIGSKLEDIFNPKDAALFLKKMRKALSTGKLVNHEFEISINGKKYIYESRITPIGNEDVLVFSRDVTEARRSNLSLKRLSQVVEQSPLSIIITGFDRTIEYVNPWFTRVSGFASEEVIGKNPKMLRSGPDQNILYDEIVETVFSGKLWKGDIQSRKKNGDIYWEYAIFCPITDKKEKVTSYITVLEDITQKVMIEKVLKDSVRTRDKIFSIISHDLRGPISNLIPMVELLFENELDPSIRNEILEGIKKSALSTFHLLENLLSWAKIQNRSIKVEKIHSNLSKMIEECIELVMPLLIIKSIHIEVDAKDDIFVFADRNSVFLILRNLLDNAVKFTPTGGTIVITARRHDREVFVEVADNGVGINPEIKDKLFHSDLFYSTDGTNNEKGSGLGLSLCKEFTEMNGGRIFVESNPGEGSRFIFTLSKGKPLQKKEPERENIIIEPNGLHDVRVLIVEDDQFNQLYEKTLLLRMDAKIDIAGDGKEAIGLIRKNQYDIVLMDIKMPVMDGIEAIKAIRGELKINTPAISVSAYSGEETVKLALASGFDDHIAKPLDPRLLFSKMAHLLKLKTRISEEPSTGEEPDRVITRKYVDTERLHKVFENDKVLICGMISKFLEITPSYYEDILLAFEKHDIESLRSVSHKLKASLQLLAKNEYVNSFKLLYENTSVPDFHKLAPLVNEFNFWFPQLCKELEYEIKLLG